MDGDTYEALWMTGPRRISEENDEVLDAFCPLRQGERVFEAPPSSPPLTQDISGLPPPPPPLELPEDLPPPPLEALPEYPPLSPLCDASPARPPPPLVDTRPNRQPPPLPLPLPPPFASPPSRPPPPPPSGFSSITLQTPPIHPAPPVVATPSPPLPPPRTKSLAPDKVLLPANRDSDVTFTTDFNVDDPFAGSPLFSDDLPIPDASRKNSEDTSPISNGGNSEFSRLSVARTTSIDNLISSSSFTGCLPARDFDGESIDDLSGDEAERWSTSTFGKGSPVKSLPVVAPKPPPEKSISSYLFVMDKSNETSGGNIGRLIQRKQNYKRYCMLDEVEMLMCIYSDEKSRVTKRVIPLDVIKNVVNESGVTNDMHKIRLTLSLDDFSSAPFSESNSRFLYICSKKQEELMEWGQRIMKIIIDRAKNTEDETWKSSIGHRLVASVIGGGADKMGWIKMTVMDGVSKKRYFVLIGGLLAYYESTEDFAACLPIHYIDMRLASVKRSEGGKGRSLLLITIPRHYTLIFANSEEQESWFTAISEAIDEAITDDQGSDILKEVRNNKSNNFCADCGAVDPKWGSLNLCLVLCKWCAGLHRDLNSNPHSKVRAFRLDTQVWTPNTVRLMVELGNERMNKFWESKKTSASSEGKAKSHWPFDKRRQYIMQKYRIKQFADRHPLHNQPEELLIALQANVQTSALFETARMIFSGDTDFEIEDTNLLELAKNSGQTLQYEFLQHNLMRSSDRRPRNRKAVRKGFVSFKTADNGFSRRWCMLASGICHFYLEENGTVAKETVDCAEDVVAICSEDDSEDTQMITLYAKQNTYKLVNVNESSSELSDWLFDLAVSCSPDVSTNEMPSKDELSLIGTLEVKRSSTGTWSQHWVCLTNNRRLLMFDESSNSRSIDKFDLRLVSSEIREESPDDGCKVFSFKVNYFSKISETSDETEISSVILYFRTNMPLLAELWWKRFDHAATKCGTNVQDQVLNRDFLPLIVAKCLSYINANSEGVDGVYRIPGVKSKVDNLLDKFRKCPQAVVLDNEDCTIHEVTSAMKAFLRGLEDPPMTGDLYKEWLKVGNYADQSRRGWYKYHLSNLPQVNYIVLRTLCIHLNKLLKACERSESTTPGRRQHMDINGVASLFAPLLLSVFRDKGGYVDTSREIAIIKDVLTDYAWLFEIDESVAEKEDERMKEVVQRIERLNKENSDRRLSHAHDLSCQKVKVPIRLEIPGRSKVIDVDISPGMKAQDLLHYILEKGHITTLTALAVFEVIVENEVERNLFPMDSLHDIMLSWTKFPEHYRKSVHLQVKNNYIFERMELQYEPDVSMLWTISYCGVSKKLISRNFSKQYQLLLQNGTISLNKFKQSASALEWHVHDIIFYHGIEKKRKSPTDWGVTFLSTLGSSGHESTDSHDDFFGHAASFSNRRELYRWLAAVYYAKYPNCETFSSFSSNGGKEEGVGKVSTLPSVRRSSSETSPRVYVRQSTINHSNTHM